MCNCRPCPGPVCISRNPLSPDGSRLIYSTYFGGTGLTSVNALAVDAGGNVYLTGSTNATDFPHTGGLSAMPAAPGDVLAPQVFAAKISPAGDQILYSGVILAGNGFCPPKGCGNQNTAGVAIALDSASNAYIAGDTNVGELPATPGALQTRGIGGFVAKVNFSGSALSFLTYIDAKPGTGLTALAVDAAGNTYVTGSTTDSQFPVAPGAFQSTFPPNGPFGPYSDGFVARLSPDGSRLLWATFLGGAVGSAPQSIALDPSGSAWVVGTTSSTDLPNVNGWLLGRDFLAELNTSGSALLYSARFPEGTVSESAALDASGRLHLAGVSGTVSAITPNQPLSTRIFAIGNAAGGAVAKPVSPGELISIYGSLIGPASPAASQPDSTGFYPTSPAGVQVFVNDQPAPLLYVSTNQVNAVIPFETSGKDSVRVRISFNGVRTVDFPAAVASTEPEIFKNSDGYIAAVNEDRTLNSSTHPAKLGSIVAIWATGTGAVPLADGQVVTAAFDDHCCEVQVNFQPADVLYAGRAPGIVAGVSQINFRLPMLPWQGVSPHLDHRDGERPDRRPGADLGESVIPHFLLTMAQGGGLTRAFRPSRRKNLLPAAGRPLKAFS